MTIRINMNAPEPLPHYPKLMISNDGLIVLFTNKKEGTAISAADDDDEIGEHSECWDMDSFRDFDGSITLSND